MSKAKCAQCRKDKAKCNPFQRLLPRRCDRCIRYNYGCSENLTTEQSKTKLQRATGNETAIAPHRLQSDAACLHEIGDLTSLLEVIKITKSLQRLHKWSYSATEAVLLRTRLEDTIHQTVKRAKQHEVEGFWREAEYLWRSIRTYASADRPREIRNARMEAKFHPAKYKNRLVGLSPLVALHERLGDFPAAEHELELLIARSFARPGSASGHSSLELEIKTLIRLYGMFQERIASYKVPGLEQKRLIELGSLSLLFRVTALECTELYVALLNSNASMFLTPGEGPTLLHLSASTGSQTFTTLLLGVGVEVDFLDHSNRTALHLAAREGHEDVAKLLLAAGAKVNEKDEDGHSSLHFACMEGHTAVASILLEKGADTQARTYEDGFTPLHLAVKSGSLDLIQLLLKHGSEMTEKTGLGRTILHLATENGDESLVKLSLENGVEVDSADAYGIRPIHDATNAAVTRLLLENKADPHSPDSFDETPLLSAAWRTDTEVVELLLKHKVNVDAQDDQGRTSLHRAAASRRLENSLTLLKHSANVNVLDSELKTPLHEAARTGELTIVNVLLGKGANPHFIDIWGKSPSDYATASREGATSVTARETLDGILLVLGSV